MDSFDPYHLWLAIPLEKQPPNHYDLLGVPLFESNTDVIAYAADQRMGHLRNLATGRYSELSQKLLNEVAAAKLCLLNPPNKAAYDTELRGTHNSVSTELGDTAAALPPKMTSPASDSSVPVIQTNDTTMPQTPAVPVRTSQAKSKQGRHKRSVQPYAFVCLFVAFAGIMGALSFINRGNKEQPVAEVTPAPLSLGSGELTPTIPRRMSEPPEAKVETEQPQPPDTTSPAPSAFQPEPISDSGPSDEELRALAQSLTTARDAIGELNFPVADRELTKALALAKLDEHQAKIERLQLLRGYVGRFQDAIRETLGRVNAGDQIALGGEKFFGIVEKTPDFVIVRINGTNQRHPMSALPPGLAVRLAEMSLDKESPDTTAMKAAYISINAKIDDDDRKKVDAWWKEAASVGDVPDLIAAINDGYRLNQANMTAPVESNLISELNSEVQPEVNASTVVAADNSEVSSSVASAAKRVQRDEPALLERIEPVAAEPRTASSSLDARERKKIEDAIARFRQAIEGHKQRVLNTFDRFEARAKNSDADRALAEMQEARRRFEYFGYLPMSSTDALSQEQQKITKALELVFESAVEVCRKQQKDELAAALQVECKAVQRSVWRNLLVNPSFEEAMVGVDNLKIPGWEIVSGNWRCREGLKEHWKTAHGENYLYPGNAAHAEIFQDVNVGHLARQLEGGLQAFEVRAYLQVYDQHPPDTCRVILEYLDAAKQRVLHMCDSGIRSPTNIWTLWKETSLAPSETKWIRVRLISHRNGAGTKSNDAMYDLISLTPVDAPPQRDD